MGPSLYLACTQYLGGEIILNEFRWLVLQQQVVIPNLRMFESKALLMCEVKRLEAFLDNGGKFQEKNKDRDMGVKEKGLNWVKMKKRANRWSGREASC